MFIASRVAHDCASNGAWRRSEIELGRESDREEVNCEEVNKRETCPVGAGGLNSVGFTAAGTRDASGSGRS